MTKVKQIQKEAGNPAIEDFQQDVEHALENLQTSMSKLEKELGKSIEFQSKCIDTLESKMAAKEKGIRRSFS